MKTPTIITTSVNCRPGEGTAKLSNAKKAHKMTNAVTSTYIKIWNKAGTVLVNNRLITSLDGNITTDYGDPNIIYDQVADRWGVEGNGETRVWAEIVLTGQDGRAERSSTTRAPRRAD